MTKCAGEVLLDGCDIKTLKLRWLRQQIGLVSQEPALFATTIKENILLGRPDADQVEVEEAARVANAHSFIIKLPEGYDTQVRYHLKTYLYVTLLNHTPLVQQSKGKAKFDIFQWQMSSLLVIGVVLLD